MRKKDGYVRFERFNDVLDFLKGAGIVDPFMTGALKVLNPRLRHPVDLNEVWFKYEKDKGGVYGKD